MLFDLIVLLLRVLGFGEMWVWEFRPEHKSWFCVHWLCRLAKLLTSVGFSFFLYKDNWHFKAWGNKVIHYKKSAWQKIGAQQIVLCFGSFSNGKNNYFLCKRECSFSSEKLAQP